MLSLRDIPPPGICAGGPFSLAAPVTAYEVRPWMPADAAVMGGALLRRLYGEFMSDGGFETVAVRVSA
jgi:hypothetical protein